MKTLLKLLFTVIMAASAFGAVAPSVTVNSITVSGSTVTVTTALAHGVAANRGFCLSAPANSCGTAITATLTTLTFSSTTVSACASACGTLTLGKQIIGLGITMPPYQSASAVCWLYTTSAVPAGTSSAFTGASAAEKNAIGAGTVIEVQLPAYQVAGATLAAFKAYAQSACASLQSALDAGIPPAFILGNYFDGTGWVN